MTTARIRPAPARVEIRKMTPQDLPQVLELEKEAFPHHPYSREVYESFMVDPKAYSVVASHQDRAVGMAVMEIGRGPSWKNSPDDPSQSYLNELAVSASMRGQKVGEQLLLHVLSACVNAGVATCTLWVLEESQNAVRLYEKFGFHDSGERGVKHYAVGEKQALYLVLPGMQESECRQRLERIRQDLERSFT